MSSPHSTESDYFTATFRPFNCIEWLVTFKDSKNNYSFQLPAFLTDSEVLNILLTLDNVVRFTSKK